MQNLQFLKKARKKNINFKVSCLFYGAALLQSGFDSFLQQKCKIQKISTNLSLCSFPIQICVQYINCNILRDLPPFKRNLCKKCPRQQYVVVEALTILYLQEEKKPDKNATNFKLALAQKCMRIILRKLTFKTTAAAVVNWNYTASPRQCCPWPSPLKSSELIKKKILQPISCTLLLKKQKRTKKITITDRLNIGKQKYKSLPESFPHHSGIHLNFEIDSPKNFPI